jgi:hypothetical protein
MMTIENNIKDVISKKLEDGTVEKLISEQLEAGVKTALQNLFRSYGDVTKIIEDQVKAVMVPYLESYDYSQYITKLDSVLVDVLKSSALENKKLLENFKKLTIPTDIKEIKVTELFGKWMDYVSKNVDTDGLGVDYDDEPRYENVEVGFEFERDTDRSWSSFDHATLVFECEHDDNMNFSIRLYRWDKQSDAGWDMDFRRVFDVGSLRYMNDFEVFLLNLSQSQVKLIIDSDEDSDEVEPEKKPEVTFE